MKGHWPVRAMCRVLSVSESGFYGWQRCGKVPGSARLPDQRLLVHIRAIHREVKEEYGWPRVYHELRRRGLRVGKERVRLLMQAHGIRGKAKRRYIATTDSRHALPVAPNLVQRLFSTAAPDRVWCSDITYLPTEEGWLYLAAVVDLFSRQVVGWSLKPHMQTSLVKDALTMACLRRRPAAGLIFHSDRGSQYCSHEFQQTLRGWQIRASMSRKGDCWDNSPTESFWARLKLACLEGRKFRSHHQAIAAVMDWISFYNHRRLHSSLGYVSPMEYEKRWHASQYKIAA
tara:strand:+ start:14844 stop:15704 length:861 start_codon:yes stop_codon:yes gene_type:complete